MFTNGVKTKISSANQVHTTKETTLCGVRLKSPYPRTVHFTTIQIHGLLLQCFKLLILVKWHIDGCNINIASNYDFWWSGILYKCLSSSLVTARTHNRQ